MPSVELGDVSFDPVATQDFRLSVSGTSGSGKSNTMAVVLEDLADVQIPTLVIERLGALTPVRAEDDAIVVVGAREEPGIDLAVGLQDLDQLGEWVLDRGMKVLLDISTYEDYESEHSRTHEAAAVALKSFNDRAHEKFRSGDRTKSLLVVDEAHMLAPKDSAPEPELDDHVKRCRGQIIKASTEGGNKGISVIVGFQRRAFLHNGVIQLAADYVAHRPGDEDIARTADALRCSEDALASLGTGEILARGETLTDGDLVGPTLVRKRRSPDPREETFELPETPDELSDVLGEIQSEVEAERERRRERQDELERLREENERLRERNDELQQELDDVDRLGSALERLGQANGPTEAEAVGEAASDLQARAAELKAERDDLEATVADLRDDLTATREQREAAEERVADLEAEVQELRSAFDAAAESVADLAERFDVDLDFEAGTTAADAEAADPDRIAELERENERLRSQAVEIDEQIEEYEEFLEMDVVREQIRESKNADRTSPRYVEGLLASIVRENGPVDYDTVAERLGISATHHIGSAATELESRGIVTKHNTNDGIHVDLNVDGINEIRRRAAEQQKTEDIMERIP